jgi:hypothetical protein
MYATVYRLQLGLYRVKDKTLRVQNLSRSVLSSLHLDTPDKCQGATTFKMLGVRHGMHIMSNKRNT